MPRQSRILSRTGCYHVMLRGNNKMKIFLNDLDKNYFLKLLDQNKKRANCQIFAYCLMDNHIHLVLQENLETGSQENVSFIMKRIGISYARYFNLKYDRIGAVFQDRFKSERVENNRYLLAVIRYILCNPWKAKLVVTPWLYRWSSIKEYLSGSSIISDVNAILPIFSKDLSEAKKLFKDFIIQDSVENFIELDKTKEEIETYLGKVWKKLDLLSIEERIKIFHNEKNVSLRKIERISGISRFKIKQYLDNQ